jgi:formylglycine-generating enzyme required for sulfatase activity
LSTCPAPGWRSAEGVCDLIGNVAEWLADTSAAGRAVAGGHFATTTKQAGVSLQRRGPRFVALDKTAPTIGFRCVRDDR